MRQNEAMPHSEETIRKTLRSHGLRNTPQRHAILNAFEQGTGEHLSAEEIHGRAASSLPGLSRGTVYAALNELTELGLVSAVGLPEPVRYELNTSPHDHFRCRLCSRLFDLFSDSDSAAMGPPRSVVERVDVRSEGICADCVDYEAGLEAGIRAIQRGSRGLPWADTLHGTDVACAATEGPLGKVLLAASSDGLLRLAFEDHFDAGALEARAGTRRGSRTAREHLKTVGDGLGRFLAGQSPEIECTVDPRGFASAAEVLPATQAIPYGAHASYLKIAAGFASRELGRWMGANPMPVVFPCHRVARGKEVPKAFVGGIDRRRWLESHEREHAPLPPAMRTRAV
jgi:Fe2+ or Zn2+ uptake regulation protein/O6-methylguanine-DNA--protein-cysteine methyltransferase